MTFKGLDGRAYNKRIDTKKYKRKKKASCRSKSQYELGKRLVQHFKGSTVLEEFPCYGTSLHLDFFIPSLKTAFEYDGPQHYEFNEFFHKTKADFARTVKNDAKKEEWCDINGILLFRISDLDELDEILC